MTLDLAWATDEDARAGTAAFERFCAATCFDESQKHWIVAHYDTVTRRRMWELDEDGAPPSCLNVPCFLLASAFGLGWLYQMWYNSLTAVVELHIKKTLSARCGRDVEVGVRI